jgi:hypothetical protein
MTRAEKRDEDFQKVYNEHIKEGKKPTKALKETRKVFDNRNKRREYV